MKILVLGASGLTGAIVVDLSLNRGDDVVVLTRDASKFAHRRPNLHVIEGSATSIPDIEAALNGVDAVIHCLGIGGKGQGSTTTVVSDSVKATLDAMTNKSVRRIVCMSNVGAGDSGTWFYNRIVLPVFLRWLKPIIEDKNRMEIALKSGSMDWVSVRLRNIVPGLESKVRTSPDGKGMGISITTESTARFLLKQVSENVWLRKSPSVSN